MTVPVTRETINKSVYLSLFHALQQIVFVYFKIKSSQNMVDTTFRREKKPKTINDLRTIFGVVENRVVKNLCGL